MLLPVGAVSACTPSMQRSSQELAAHSTVINLATADHGAHRCGAQELQAEYLVRRKAAQLCKCLCVGGIKLAHVSSHQLRACSPLRAHRSVMPPRRRRLVRQGPAFPPLQGGLGSTPPAPVACCTSDGASSGVPAAPPAAVHAPDAAAPAACMPDLHAAKVAASDTANSGAAAAAAAAGCSRASRCCSAPKVRRRHCQESCCVPAVACCPVGGRACCGCCCC